MRDNELTITIKFRDIEKTMSVFVPEYKRSDVNPNPTPLDKTVNAQISGMIEVLRNQIIKEI